MESKQKNSAFSAPRVGVSGDLQGNVLYTKYLPFDLTNGQILSFTENILFNFFEI